MVVHQLPVDAPFLLYKFEELRRRGWRIEMVCAGREVGRRPALVAVSAEAKRHVHYSWPTQSRFVVLALFPIALATCTLKNPVGTWRYLRGGAARFGAQVFRYFYLDAAIIAVRPDVVHFEFGPIAVDRMHLRELLGCAVTVSFRGYDLNYVGLGDPNYYDKVWQYANGLHLLGEDLWRRALARACPPDKFHVLIPPATNTRAFAPGVEREAVRVGTRERPLHVVSVGRVVWKKGYEYALQAVRQLQDRGVACEFRIVGDGEYFEAVAFARHQMGLEGSVTLVGACPVAEIKMHLEWADVFLHSATSEGFCNAVIEAQANALPVVTSDADGLAENVVDGVTGFVVPRRRPDQLADRLERLAVDGALRRRLGDAARLRAVKHFSVDDQITAFEAFYRVVAAQVNSTVSATEDLKVSQTDAR